MNFLTKFPNYLDQKFAGFTIWLIKGYQKTISPDHSELGKCDKLSGCKFYPSCSQYAVEVLKSRGFLFGMPKVVWRVLRCHPWSAGGVDKP
jgi:putative membrane protein insertion efficiency factor